MNGIRRTLSFRKKKKKPEITDGSKPQQWLDDEAKIKEGCCSFHVKYLGSIEVYESRGMQVCEEAIRALRKSKKKPQKAVLYVSGDALRVSDDASQQLIVDQTIEKVSFCAPDRNHDKGFAYICRDGATRRWMCHAFLAIRESGERLSHAVGCAFAICLEKKQKRERDALQLASSDERSFVRTSFTRPTSLAERLIDPQSAIVPPTLPPPPSTVGDLDRFSASSTATASPITGTIARPRPCSSLFERQSSLRLFPKLQDASPFKRDLSLRLSELPSNLQRLARNTMNGHSIPEENGTENDESLPSVNSKADRSPQPSPHTNSTSPQPESTAVQQASAVQWDPSFSSTTSSAFNPSTTFMDPFSAAPFPPFAIPQQPDSRIPSSSTGSNEVYALAQLSISPKPTPPTVPAISKPPTTSPSIQHPSSPNYPAIVNSSSITSPTQQYWSNTAVPNYAPAMTSAYPYYPATVANPVIPFGYPSFPATNPYVMATPLSVQPSSWMPHSNFTQDWCPPLPSLLPPEPTRFSDPFDVGWTERATAVPTVAGTNSATMLHKSGNPFLSPEASAPASPTVDGRNGGGDGRRETATFPA